MLQILLTGCQLQTLPGSALTEGCSAMHTHIALASVTSQAECCCAHNMQHVRVYHGGHLRIVDVLRSDVSTILAEWHCLSRHVSANGAEYMQSTVPSVCKCDVCTVHAKHCAQCL